MKSKESRKNRETALSIKRAWKRFQESGWYREHSSLSALADGDFLLYSAIKSYPLLQTGLQKGIGLDGTVKQKVPVCKCRQGRMFAVPP